MFECRQCGECCMYLGDYLVIEHEPAPFEFECCSVSTGTPFLARIDPDKHDLFRERSWIERHPHACRFLRPSAGGRIVCTIHETSPIQCKAYRCTVMRIITPEGDIVGRVTGTLALHTEDPGLRRIWESVISSIPSDAPGAEDRIAGIIRESGYLVA
ncbi:MAG: hypothetical protein LUQ25_02190 [Methanoregulaceae archaeon]|nr:hypothetical protein [Methanoregulaceae archaeon]